MLPHCAFLHKLSNAFSFIQTLFLIITVISLDYQQITVKYYNYAF